MTTRISVLVLAAAVAGGAAAADWKPISERQANLFARIEAGIRNGSLTEQEAGRLKARFNNLAMRDERYRKGGYSDWERNDLQRRLDELSERIRYQKNDGDVRR